MKKVLLTLLTAVVGLSAYAQDPSLIITAPTSIAGGVTPITYVGNGGTDWGSPDMRVDTNAIVGELIYVEDATAADSLACDSVITPNVTGKIAVLYRGSCQFGTKALNAQKAGAIGVVIVTYPGEDPAGMAGGDDGLDVTIPVAMIRRDDNDAIKSQIQAGGVMAFFGVKAGYFNNDIGMDKPYTAISPYTAVFDKFNPDSSYYQIPVQSYVMNFGKNDQTGVKLAAKISLDGTEIYNEESDTFSINAGDTFVISLPAFAQETYANGNYELTYSLSSDSTEDADVDNVLTSKFNFNNGYYSYADQTDANIPNASNFYRHNSLDDFEGCIHYKTPDLLLGTSGDKLSQIKYIDFATTAPSGESIDGEEVDIIVYAWNDDFEDISTAPTFDDLEEVYSNTYTYDGDDLNGENVRYEIPSGDIEGVTFGTDQRVLVCVKPLGTVFVGYSEENNYLRTVNNLLQPIAPILSSNDPSANTEVGFGWGIIPAVNVGISHSINVDDVKSPVLSSYPNPAVNFVNIPLEGINMEDAKLSVVDVTGKVVLSKSINVKGAVLKQEVSSLANGVYTFSVTNAEGVNANVKVVVNN
jgi:hypothetical protein